MSYLTLLFPAARQNLSNASGVGREAEWEARVSGEASETPFAGAENGAGNYRLPSGIDSLDHWLDLNA